MPDVWTVTDWIGKVWRFERLDEAIEHALNVTGSDNMTILRSPAGKEVTMLERPGRPT